MRILLTVILHTYHIVRTSYIHIIHIPILGTFLQQICTTISNNRNNSEKLHNFDVYNLNLKVVLNVLYMNYQSII